MLKAAPHFLGFVLPAVIVAGVRLGGPWTFLPVALLLVALPIIDMLSGLNVANAGDDEDIANDPAFRVITWVWTAVQPLLLWWALGVVAAGRLSAVELAGLTLSIGLTTGAVGVTFAHELVHRPGRFERALGEILVATTSYTHFCIEHVSGHHRHVGTPRDPATARFGEWSYVFIPRSVFGGMRSAWTIECARLDKRGHGPWHPANRMLRYALTQVVMYGSVFAWFGARGAGFLAAQAVVAIVLLETINYVEHYGLFRLELSPGRYERVMPWHSWNSSHRVSNWLLINLARHADHHMIASKRYQVLDHLGTAPQLPAGYGSMLMLALVPPLWRRVMDPRVLEWRRAHAGGAALNALDA